MEKRILKVLAILALLTLLGWLVYQASTIIVYILLAVVVALIGRPLFKVLERVQIKGRHLPDSLKAAITLIVIFGVIGGLLSVFVPMIVVEAQLLTTIDLDQVKEAMSPGLNWFNRMVDRINLDPDAKVDQNNLIQHIFDSLDIKAFPSFLNTIVSTLGNLLIAIFSVAFMSFFFLKDKDLLTDVVMKLVPGSKEIRVKNILRNTRSTLSRYFLGLLIQVIAVTICVFIGLQIAGVENALLIAVFSGIVNLVPYLGPWIGASFGIFILVANNIDANFLEVIEPKIIGLLIVFASTQMIDNYVFQPAIFSNSINANPLEIFIVILVAGSLGGVGGMIAAIPVYSFIRIVFTEMNREFGWLERIKER
jgi:predicted PurR-regulated permease PerM